MSDHDSIIGHLMSCHVVVALSSWCCDHAESTYICMFIFLSCFCHVYFVLVVLRCAESTFSSCWRKFGVSKVFFPAFSFPWRDREDWIYLFITQNRLTSLFLDRHKSTGGPKNGAVSSKVLWTYRAFKLKNACLNTTQGM